MEPVTPGLNLAAPQTRNDMFLPGVRWIALFPEQRRLS